MRYRCYFCTKSVTSELPDDTVIRALLICPECIAEGKVLLKDDNPNTEVPGRTYHPFDPDGGEL